MYVLQSRLHAQSEPEAVERVYEVHGERWRLRTLKLIMPGWYEYTIERTVRGVRESIRERYHTLVRHYRLMGFYPALARSKARDAVRDEAELEILGAWREDENT